MIASWFDIAVLEKLSDNCFTRFIRRTVKGSHRGTVQMKGNIFMQAGAQAKAF
jgi:hypothetical protein